ncbi:Transposase IS66 family protein [Nitrosomonas sp. Nm132]|nr:Transposase IS66 family protein [Nitrosomonas sp. Nm132]
MAMEALQRIGVLYAIETEGKHLTIEDRQQLRAEKSLPALNALHDWLIQTRTQTANGGGSAKALDYTLKRWPSLTRYAQSGHLPIDNNPVENAIRPIALGKKNWLFTGSERAGQRAAAIQTLFGTAQLNGLDPSAWLNTRFDNNSVFTLDQNQCSTSPEYACARWRRYKARWPGCRYRYCHNSGWR